MVEDAYHPLSGVYKSEDGGSTWSAASTGLLDGFAVYAIAIDPVTSSLYAGLSGYDGRSGGGVFKSTDGGETWNVVNTGLPSDIGVHAIAIDPTTTSTLYVGTDVRGVFKSTNGGATWSDANTGLPPNLGVFALAIDPASTLYVGGDSGGVFKSTDCGGTWSPANTDLPTDMVFSILTIDPVNSSTLFAGKASFWGTDGGIFKSTDGGGTWNNVTSNLPTDYSFHSLAIDPTTSTIYVAAFQHGVFASRDGGNTWSDLTADLGDLQTHTIVIAATTPTTIYVGTCSFGVYLYNDSTTSPGKATLVSPLSAVTTVTPSFTWNAEFGTRYYLLRVIDRDGVIVDRWYVPAAVGCPIGTGTCTASPGISLKAGTATWGMLTWNWSGYGPWSATQQFFVEIADSAALTPAAVSPMEAIVSTNVTYRWTAVAGALSYLLSIRNNGGAPIYSWYTPAAAGCDAASECSAVPQVALLSGAAEWQVQVWTNSGYGPWSSAISLSVNIPAPPAPTLVSPSGGVGTTSPPFRWNASANVILYYIRAADYTGLRVDRWLAPSQVGCASGGVCTLSPGVTLASGAGSWQVIAWNPSGYSPWSSMLAFVVP
jgi:photosystem II stability/assembly factor-like uncharacterized protein